MPWSSSLVDEGLVAVVRVAVLRAVAVHEQGHRRRGHVARQDQRAGQTVRPGMESERARRRRFQREVAQAAEAQQRGDRGAQGEYGGDDDPRAPAQREQGRRKGGQDRPVVVGMRGFIIRSISLILFMAPGTCQIAHRRARRGCRGDAPWRSRRVTVGASRTGLRPRRHHEQPWPPRRLTRRCVAHGEQHESRIRRRQAGVRIIHRDQFRVRGRRCVERIRAKPTAANLKRAAERRSAIQAAIARGDFDYDTEFPKRGAAGKPTQDPA